MISYQLKKVEEIVHFYDNCEDIISVDECEPNSLIIFDDCVNMRQQYVVKDYFVRGQHKKYLAFIWHNLTQKSIDS